MTDKSKGKRWNLVTKTVVLVVALLIVYPASIAPAYWIKRTAHHDEFFVIYRPLNWACANCKPLRRAVLSYLEICGYGPACGTHSDD